ncbi:hypothetical protein [Iningainema tapete]|uniref:Uncharacterized protein n=1 Tax=Iningainema tapete BLCC-T55 TaxID=2748662 RepID=A0A8J7C441_9CYAN|nr:hypothetical protein [Iningainema tapete]MBD2770909.1 hypothetical protein [Iningainema tapete BLCC-T55]
MQIEQTEVIIPTPDGQMPAFLYTQAEGDTPSSPSASSASLRFFNH